MTIKLRFVSSNDAFSRAIRAAETGFLYDHVEAVTPEGLYLGAVLNGGVQARQPDYDKGQWQKQLFVDLPADPNQSSAFYGFLESQIGAAYDTGDIVELGKNVIESFAALPREICSEFISKGLLLVDWIKCAPATPKLTTPRDVLVMCGVRVAIGEPQSPPP